MITRKLIIKSASTSKITIAGYASVFDVIDAHNDIVVKGAFLSSLIQHYHTKYIKFLWQHNMHKPIGLIKQIYEDEYGLFVEAEINTSTIYGKEAESLIKQGAIYSFSIGFEPLETETLPSFRLIKQIKLIEVSVVTVPANSYALINSIIDNTNIQSLEKKLDNCIATVNTHAADAYTKYFQL